MSSPHEDPHAGISRRTLLRLGLAGGVVLAAGGLSACGGAASSPTESSASAGPPRKGGILTVAMISGGQAETLDPYAMFAPMDYARTNNIYDRLFEYDDELKVNPALAESGEASADLKTWTLKLRKGVLFHDGTPFTADAVLAAMKVWSDPNAIFHGQVGNQLDMANTAKVDDHTVKVALNAPNARFDQDLAFVWGAIKSTTEKQGGPPVGTGPFKFVSFTPGSRSEFARNDAYWGEPAYVDTLVIDTSFTDENTRLNALRSGQVQVVPSVSATLAKTISGDARLLKAKSAAFQNFYMRTDSAPFNDVNVRQAMRLLVDRQAMVDVSYGGYGSVSNDIPGQGLPYFDETLKRDRDLDQAKFLLKKAGKEGLAVTLQTSAVGGGITEAATLFKEQAKQAGVRVNLAQVDPAQYFDPSTHYGKMPFAQTIYFPVPSLAFVWNASIMPKSVSNEMHWYEHPLYERSRQLFAETKATTDESKLTELWKELQLQQFNEGGYINFGVADFIDGVSNKVQGLTESKYMNASGWNFRKAWLTA